MKLRSKHKVEYTINQHSKIPLLFNLFKSNSQQIIKQQDLLATKCFTLFVDSNGVMNMYVYGVPYIVQDCGYCAFQVYTYTSSDDKTYIISTYCNIGPLYPETRKATKDNSAYIKAPLSHIILIPSGSGSFRIIPFRLFSYTIKKFSDKRNRVSIGKHGHIKSTVASLPSPAFVDYIMIIIIVARVIASPPPHHPSA